MGKREGADVYMSFANKCASHSSHPSFSRSLACVSASVHLSLKRERKGGDGYRIEHADDVDVSVESAGELQFVRSARERITAHMSKVMRAL